MQINRAQIEERSFAVVSLPGANDVGAKLTFGEQRMSDKGQTQASTRLSAMSALALTSDIVSVARHVRYGPDGERSHREAANRGGLRLRAGVELDVEHSPPFRIIPRRVFGKHFKLAREAAEAPRYFVCRLTRFKERPGTFARALCSSESWRRWAAV